MTEPREVKIAEGSTNGGRYGLKCSACGKTLVGVEKVTTSDGFINRRRVCECGEVHITDERIIHSHPVRSYNRKLSE